MELFKKKAKTEEINENEDIQTTEVTEEDGGEALEEILGEDNAPTPHKDLRLALVRCGAALFAAAIMLLATGFSAINLIKGPVESVSIQEEENGAFVKKEVIAILDNYAPEGSKAIFAVVPMNGALVTIDFSRRYSDSVSTIMDETDKLVAGELAALDKYVVVQGTVSELSDEQSKQLYDWFDANRDEMVEKNVISADYSAVDYLSEKVLLVDTVNGRSQTLVMVLSGLATLLVLYVVAELVLMALGFYKPKKEKNEDDAGEAETAGDFEGLQDTMQDNTDSSGEEM